MHASENLKWNWRTLKRSDMKRLILLLLLTFPFVSEVAAQKKVKLRTDTIDKFENKREIETDWIKVYSSMKLPTSIYFSIEHKGDTPCLAVKILSGEVDVVRKGAPAKFVMSDGDVKELLCSGETWSDVGKGAIGLSGSKMQGLYIRYTGDLSFLAEGTITDVRFVGQEYNYDATLKEKAQKQIKAMYETYANAIK